MFDVCDALVVSPCSKVCVFWLLGIYLRQLHLAPLILNLACATQPEQKDPKHSDKVNRLSLITAPCRTRHPRWLRVTDSSDCRTAKVAVRA